MRKKEAAVIGVPVRLLLFIRLLCFCRKNVVFL
nr:MAG TPA: hypothetical protein [Caudoviricetes sp.]